MGSLVQGGSISFDELASAEAGGPSPRIMASRDSRSATRIGIINWTDIDAALLELFPNPPALPGTYPGVSYLFADGVSEIVAWPDSPPNDQVTCPSGVNLYSKAKITVTYSTLKYDESDLISRSRTYSVEAMPLPEIGLVWQDTAQPIQLSDIQAYKNIPIIEHQITLYRGTTSADSNVRDLAGKVNSSTFEGGDTETLLFLGAEENFTISTAGVKSYTQTFRFKERRIKDGSSVYGWNHAWRHATGEWAKLLTTQGNTLYPTGSFASLY